MNFDILCNFLKIEKSHLRLYLNTLENKNDYPTTTHYHINLDHNLFTIVHSRAYKKFYLTINAMRVDTLPESFFNTDIFNSIGD